MRQRLETTTDILARLYPASSVDALTGLSREELFARLDPSVVGADLHATPDRHSLDTATNDQGSFVSNGSLSMGGMVPDSRKSREDQGSADTAVASDSQQNYASSENGDDVNALSAPTNQPSSYVGPSSTMQMFRTILRIAPESVGQQQPSRSPTAGSQQSGSVRSPVTTQRTPSSFQSSERVHTLIDSYFNWVHPATAVIDETEFRNTATSGTRKDSPWLCLFNMVLTLGSIGTTKAESKEHLSYYHVAKFHLDLEGLGNKSFETLQALILMAGWYNHYRNRPNLASALLGAAFRMAYALGLHKEVLNRNQPVEHQELRRKIWWNLVVFDAAEAVTLGRTLDTKIFETEVECPRDIGQNVSVGVFICKTGPSSPLIYFVALFHSKIG